jgi:hypothetical protein
VPQNVFVIPTVKSGLKSIQAESFRFSVLNRFQNDGIMPDSRLAEIVSVFPFVLRESPLKQRSGQAQK